MQAIAQGFALAKNNETSGVSFLKSSFSDALATADKPIMIDFWSDGWGGCVQLDRAVFQDEEVGNFVNNHFINLRIDGTKGEGKKLRKKYKILGFPTVLFVNQKGEEIDRICGFYGDRDATFQTIQDYANGKNTLTGILSKLKQDKKNVKLNYKLAQKHVSRWEGNQAKPYFKNVLKLDPNDEKGFKTESIFNIALYDARFEKNVKPLLKFMAQNSDEKYYEKGYYNLLGYYKKTKDQDGMVKTYESMVKKMAANAGLYNQYAWFIYEERMKNKYDWGIKLAKKAVELQPDAAHIWDTLAWLHFEKGNKKKALKAMKKAVELEPETKGFKKNLKKMKKGVS